MVPYYSYSSGTFRADDGVDVGERKPLPFSELPDELRRITELSKNASSVENVFEIHGRMYAAHFFRNGNKRLSRTVENALLKNLGFEFLNPNIGYHFGKRKYLWTMVE